MEVQDKGVGWFAFLWGLYSWLADSCLLYVSSHGLYLCTLTLRSYQDTSPYKDTSHIGHLEMSYRHLVKIHCALNLSFGFHTCINFGKNCFDSSRYLWLYWPPKWNIHKTFGAFEEHWSKAVLFFHTCIHLLFPFSGWISFVKQFKTCLMFLQVLPSAAILTLGSTCYLKNKQKDWKGPESF